jgi:phenylacetate-CoA ligase
MNLAPKLEGLYERLPVSLQNLACSVEGWRVDRRRYDSEFFVALAACEARARWSREAIRDYRDEQLKRFVAEASLTVPYYRHLFRTSTNPYLINGMDDLRDLPILHKMTVRQRPKDFRADISVGRQSVHTSGTTGAGLRFEATLSALREQWATWWRYRRWHGIDIGTWCGYFGGRVVVPPERTSPPFWRTNYPGRQILFSAYHMSTRNLPHYLRWLRSQKPPWLHGYPSLLALLAGYMLDTGLDLGYQPRWITLGAENVTEKQGGLIQRAFGVKPLQHYGMAEAAANASECDHGELHVAEDFSAFEIVGGPDGTGLVVGTNFTNPAFPLIRYAVGDVAAFADSECSCGRPGRVLRALDGRLEDYVLLPSGARLGRLDHIFKDAVNVTEAQIYQEAVGRITFRIVRGAHYSPSDEQDLLREARKRLGTGTTLEIEYVDALERSPGGKVRLVVSRVS